ncbi:sensor histidine kinase, partial [Candidatus Pelagibacter sp.]|nr:sensor histidine kinase [Candidatus Pelagibacter sp.]
MKFFETSKYFSLKKSTYINLRWIAIIGQLITVNFIYFVFDFRFNLTLANSTILIGILTNLYLIYINQNTQLTDKIAFIFLSTDILQLSCLIYLTGGIINPFSIFLIIPAIFSSSNLGFRSNLLLVSLTVLVIIFLTFFNQPLPYPISKHFHVDSYYYYSIPIALIIALLFLNYFASTFGSESRIRKEALNKMEEIMSKEHELLSLGGQAAAAAHSLGTPFSTMKIISTDLREQFKDNENVKKDIELLSSQLERCSEILKKLTLNPVIEDNFIDSDLTIS